ncbi:transposase, partial [Limimaricola sp. ASW11-118]|nr:transposase [Limimaricola litoreus]
APPACHRNEGRKLQIPAVQGWVSEHYDYNAVRPHSSLGNQTPLEARRALEQFEGSAPGALARNDQSNYQSQTRKLSL